MKTLGLILIVFGAVLGTYSTEAQTVSSRVEPISQYPDASSDAQLKKQLDSLVTQADWFPEITLKVQDGVITIDGRTNKKEHLQFLVTAAQRLPGAVAVINKAEVQAPVINDLQPVIAETQKILERTKQLLPTLLIGIVLLVGFIFLGGYVSTVVRALWKTRIKNPFLLALVTRATLVPIWLTLFYLALRTVGFPNVGATIIGGTGFLGILIGLSFKGIAENYLAGILLASRSPFTKGDLIQVGEYQGYVQNLNMRGTTIIDLNGNLILIPNIMVIQSVVENRSANPNMRTSFFVNIGYQDSITQAQSLIVAAMGEVKGVLENPAPSVVVDELTPAAVRLKILIWLDLKQYPEARVKSRAMIRTKETLLSHGMSIPDESREVVFADTLKIKMITKEAEADVEQDRKSQIRQKAASNLEESKTELPLHESLKEDLMDQADKNPLPVNQGTSDLLPNKLQETKPNKRS